MSEPYYTDDHVTLWHGDCREITDWLNADVLITDPPYGMALRSSRNGELGDLSIQGDNDLTVRDGALAAWGDKPAVIFGRWSLPAPTDARAMLIWDKGEHTGMGDLSLPWKPDYEVVFIRGRGFKGRRGTSILRQLAPSPAAAQGRMHPTEKPIALMSHFVERAPDGVIGDPFAGSGSTLVAARNLGRKAIGVELEERYCEVIAKRLDQGVLDFGGAA